MMRYVPGGILGVVVYAAILFYLIGCAPTPPPCENTYDPWDKWGSDSCYRPDGSCVGYECP